MTAINTVFAQTNVALPVDKKNASIAIGTFNMLSDDKALIVGLCHGERTGLLTTSETDPVSFVTNMNSITKRIEQIKLSNSTEPAMTVANQMDLNLITNDLELHEQRHALIQQVISNNPENNISVTKSSTSNLTGNSGLTLKITGVNDNTADKTAIRLVEILNNKETISDAQEKLSQGQDVLFSTMPAKPAVETLLFM